MVNKPVLASKDFDGLPMSAEFHRDTGRLRILERGVVLAEHRWDVRPLRPDIERERQARGPLLRRDPDPLAEGDEVRTQVGADVMAVPGDDRGDPIRGLGG